MKALSIWLGRLSLAQRLVFSAVVCSASILFFAAILLSNFYRSAAVDEFDERLNVYLHALLAEVASPDDELRSESGRLSEPYFTYPFSGWYWQITRIDGNRNEVKTSHSLSSAHLPRLADQGVEADLGGSRQGYVEGPDHRILRMIERIINVEDVGIYLVQVAATTEDLEQKIHFFQGILALVFFVLALVLVGASAMQIYLGLSPLRRLQQRVSAVRRAESERIEGDFPKDLAPLADELNLLTEANRKIVERARTQVGNLAHALKTPLSVILNEYDENSEQYAMIVRYQARLMGTQVNYYLDRARMAARAGSVGLAVEVVPVVEALVRSFSKLCADRRLSFEYSSHERLKFAGEKQDLEEIIGNIVDNACKWANSQVIIRIDPVVYSDRRPYFAISIDDDGKGLAPDQRQAALRRGDRLDETKPGSGLGLSIVRELVELYGGILQLTDSQVGGLRVRLQLPSA